MAREQLSKISLYHYYKLIGRSLLFLAALVIYIVRRADGEAQPLHFLSGLPWLSFILFIFFTVEILFRFFPSSIESMGCQKQFAHNYRPTETANSVSGERVRLASWRSTLVVAIVWWLLNLPAAILYFTGVIDAGILLLLSLFYAVADMICILFFCPFQTWFMKNKCCGSCRIYNWDYAMMFTPLVLIPNIFALSLFSLAFLLLIFWEIAAFRHPERFSPATNASLRCANCPEKLCHHKRQLRAFLKKNSARLRIAESIALVRKKLGLPEKPEKPERHAPLTDGDAALDLDE